MTKTQRQQVIEYLNKTKFRETRLAYHAYKNAHWEYYTLTDLFLEKEYNHRDVLPNEVVLDFDEEDIETNAHYASKVIVFLKEQKIKHSVWYTGGKGVHIHTFWHKLENATENKLVKNLLADWMTSCINILVDKQLMGRHLVRMEFGHHEKRMPEKVYKVPIGDSFKDHFKKNRIPAHIWNNYEEKVLFYCLRRLQNKDKSYTKGQMPECLKHIMHDEFSRHKDGGKRAVFVIASYFRNLPDKELGDLLSRYNKYVLREPLLEEQLYATIMSVRKNKGRSVGCAYRHDLLRDVGAGNIADDCERKYATGDTQRDKQNN